jgi:uncharacterized protein (TIGR00288 family)
MKLLNLFSWMTKSRLAILVDGDNISPASLKDVLHYTKPLGRACIRRIYANWAQYTGWKKLLQALAFEPIQRFSHTSGKNGTDIVIAIDAMDLLHKGKLDGFCLVSNDGDFTPLAIRLKQDGLKVYGFGYVSPQPFINACDQYFSLQPPVKSDHKKKVKPKAQAVEITLPQSVPLSEDVETLLLNAHSNHVAREEWLSLSILGSEMKRLRPTFSSKQYGHATLRKLIMASAKFECDFVSDDPMVASARPKSVNLDQN